MSTIIWFDSYKFLSTISNVYTFAKFVYSPSGGTVLTKVTCDPSGNVYVTGYYTTGAVSLETHFGERIGGLPTTAGSQVAFVSKFDSNGVYKFSRIVDTAGADQGLSVACDSSGSMYIGGVYTGTPTIKNQVGFGLNTLPASSGGTNAAFVSKFNSSGTYQYSLVVDGTVAGADFCYSVACDSLGNVYMAGNYAGTPSVFFVNASNVSSNVATLPASISSTNAAFVSKFNSTGTYQYSLVVDSAGADQCLAVACDSSNNVYMGGYYSGTPSVRFVNASNVSTTVATLPTTSGGGGTSTAFVSKFNSTGTYQYSLVVEASGTDFCYSVACDSSNNMYMGGYYNGLSPSVFLVNASNVSSNVATLPVSTGTAAFVSKFNSSGTYQYSLVVDSAGSDISYSVACDSSNNVYMGGYYTGTPTVRFVDSSNVATTLITLPASNGQTAFISKFDSTGAYKISRLVDTSGTDVCNGIACDPVSRSLYAVGTYATSVEGYIRDDTTSGTVVNVFPVTTTSPGFMCKFDSTTFDYNPQQLGADTMYYRIVDMPNLSGDTQSIALDSYGFVYLAGSVFGSTTSCPIKDENGTTLGTVTSVNSVNTGFVSKFTAGTGSYQYNRALYNATQNAQFYSVACDSVSSNVYVGGSYTNSASILNSNGGTTLATLPVSNGGSIAAVVSKFNRYGTYLYSLIVDSSGSDTCFSVACDSSNNVYMGGYYPGATPVIRFVNSSNVSSNVATLPSGNGTAFVSKFNSTGTYQYSFVVEASGADFCYSVACDSSGSVYMGGYYSGTTPTVRFVNSSNVSSNVATLPASLGANPCAFVSKFNSTGTYQYSIVIDSVGSEQIRSTTCDSSGSVYMGGFYGGTPSIFFVNSSNVSSNVATLPATSAGTAFVSKFNSTGTYQYSLVVDSAGADQCLAVACDSSNNLYMGGYYTGTPSIFFVNSSNVSTTVATLPASSGGSQAAFMCKFNSSGTYQYSLVVDSGGGEQCRTIICDSSNNVYMGGFYTGTPTVRFVNSSNVATTLATLQAPTAYAAFMLKFDSTGKYDPAPLNTFARIVDSVGSDFSLSVACDTFGGNSYMGGYYNGNPTIKNEIGTSLGTLPTSSGQAAFFSKFNGSGTYQYSRIVDSTGTDTAYYVTCDLTSNVYLSGVYNGTPTIKDQANTSLGNLPASSGDAAFACKFNSTGTYQYSRTVDGTGGEASYTVACDYLGAMYIGGVYSGTPTIKNQAGTGLGTLPASSGGTQAAFACKFNNAGTYLYSLVVDSAGNDITYPIACDSSNNVYMGGSYNGTPSVFFVNTSNISTTVATLPASSGGTNAAFASKFDSTGTYLYSFVVDSAGSDICQSVTCDSSNNLYMGGVYTGTPSVFFVNSSNVSSNVATLPASTGGTSAAFVSKFDSSGTYQYSFVVDDSSSDICQSVACDSLGNVYMGGYYTGTPTISFVNSSNVATTVATLPASLGGTQAAFLCKFNSTGTYQYYRVVDSTSGNDSGYSITCDSSDNVFFSGDYNGTASLIDDTNFTVYTFPASAGSDVAFMLKFNSDGTFSP